MTHKEIARIEALLKDAGYQLLEALRVAAEIKKDSK